MGKLVQNSEYKRFIAALKSQIQSAQIKAAVAVNQELLKLYWHLGSEIIEKQAKSQWGDGLIKQISRDLQQEFPDMKGFSVRNLELMRKWYRYWTQSDEITKQVVSQLEQAPIFQIPWGQNLMIISKASSTEEALFYVQKTIVHVRANGRSPLRHNRKSIRLKNYDYSQAGLYFVTICTQNRLHLFGEIVNDEMVLNDAGLMVQDEWYKSEKIRDEIKIHEFVIMPNHIHGIVEITVGANVGANGRSPVQSPVKKSMQPKSIGSLVAGFKSSFTTKMNRIDGMPKRKIWQRNYWEHIIRNDNEYNRIAQYIVDNPKKWALDKLNGGDGNQVMESCAMYRRTAVRPYDEVWMV